MHQKWFQKETNWVTQIQLKVHDEMSKTTTAIDQSINTVDFIKSHGHAQSERNVQKKAHFKIQIV